MRFPFSRAAALLLLTSSLAWGLASADDDSGTFCQNLMTSLGSCPVVPTVNTVDLTKITGRWFVIGSSANFAFSTKGRQAAQCSTANYTSSGLTSLKFINRGLQVVSPSRISVLQGFSNGFGSMSQGIRNICVLKSSNTTKTLSIDALIAVAKQNLTFLSGSAAENVSDILGAVEDDLAYIDATVYTVWNFLNAMQGYNAALSGSGLPDSYDAYTSFAVIGAICNEVIPSFVSFAQDLLSDTVALATNAVKIAGKTTQVTKPLSQLIKQLNSVKPLLNAMNKQSLAIASTALKQLPKAGDPFQSKLISVSGNLQQNAVQKGLLNPNFNIIKLDGTASAGYSTALVYNCIASTAAGPQINVFLLARTPTVDQSTIEDAISFLDDKGIRLVGSNYFTIAAQNSTLCLPVTSLP